MLTSSESGLLGLISGRRAKAHVAQLVVPPERVAGSSAERQGAEQVRDLLRPFMDHCELEGYPAKVYTRGEGYLAIASPVRSVLRPVHVNATSGAGRGVGRLVDVGAGRAADFDRLGGDLLGCVALLTLGRISDLGRMGSAATEARLRGMGCLLYHFRDRPHPSIHVSDEDLPTLTISNDSAAQLRALLEQHGDVQVEYAAQIDEADGVSYNVVGTIRGSEWPQQVIYVTSHHDTFFDGANDNNSSTAVLLEFAALLNERRPKRTFKFVVFGGEEGGAARGSTTIYHDRGSLAFTEEHQERLVGASDELAVAVINGEILGYSGNAPLRCTPELAPLLWQVVADLGVNRQVMDTRGFWTGSDHLCFHTLGIPSIEIMPDEEYGTGEAYWALYHTPLDNLGNVFEDALEANARAFALIALRLDADENPPLSLADVLAVARHDLDVLPNAASITELLRQHVESIDGLQSGEERLRRQLAFIRAVYRNIYCFAGVAGAFRLTQGYLAETLARLREAHYLAAVDGDLAGARGKVLATADGQFTATYSAAMYDDTLRRRAGTTFLTRWSSPFVDLREVLRLSEQAEAADAFVAAVRDAITYTQSLATETGQQFEDALRALPEAHS